MRPSIPGNGMGLCNKKFAVEELKKKIGTFEHFNRFCCCSGPCLLTILSAKVIAVVEQGHNRSAKATFIRLFWTH